MSIQNTYIPILKGKDGEYRALEVLSGGCKDSIVPMIELIPFSDDDSEEKMVEQLNKFIKNIVQKWGKGRKIFIDLNLIKRDYDFTINGVRPLIYVFDELRREEILAIPVAHVMSAQIFYNDLKPVIKKDKRGFCLRLHGTDFTNKKLDEYITKIVDFTKTPEEEIDLIIDLKDMIESNIDAFFVTTTTLINNSIPNIKKWRSLTLTGTSFPVNLGNVTSNSDTQLPRAEWKLWQKIFQNKNDFKRLPAYGDYSIAHSELPMVNPKIMNMSANIRYTSDDYWLVLKGKGVKQSGFGQFHTLSLLLTEMDEYSGREFSWGDEYIEKCAKREEKTGTGNATTWRKVGNSRHITYVVSQLSNHPLS